MRRKLENKNTRKIFKHGQSYAINLPIEMVKDLKWRNNDIASRYIVERVVKSL